MIRAFTVYAPLSLKVHGYDALEPEVAYVFTLRSPFEQLYA
jgi:hypothetical protein